MSPKKIFRMMSGNTRLGFSMEALMGATINGEQIAAGDSGAFDARSLSCYLAIARSAGIECVPAMPLVTVSAKKINRLVSGSENPVDLAEIERMHDAMEALPLGWMVRHDHVGDDSLKIAAAMGTPPKDGMEQIGWALHKNRALPRFWDKRVYTAMARSLVDEQRFFARPWIDAKRRRGEDPHRAGTQFAGEGSWPREWRAYIMNGKVIGISNYYIQTPAAGDAEDQSAVATVRKMAEVVVNQMRDQGLTPTDPMIRQIQRASKEVAKRMPAGGIHCSLDFIETTGGRILLLEGGPPYTPAPYRYGAHPCCFLGSEWPEGIAYGLPEGVSPFGVGGSEPVLGATA